MYSKNLFLHILHSHLSHATTTISSSSSYKNAFHGIYRVAATEGVLRLWAGASMNCTRSALMTIGQLSFYDQAKQMLLTTPYFKDNVVTHVTSSLIAVSIGLTIYFETFVPVNSVGR